MTTATGSHSLAGALWLRPGAAVPHGVRSSRQNLAERLAAGQTVERLPGLLSSLFSLCGSSHRLCSTMAIAAASGDDASPPDADAIGESLRRETAAEHVRRISLDWPRQLAPESLENNFQAKAVASLQTCPLLKRAADNTMDWVGVRAWVHQQYLHMAPAAWLEQWQAGGASWLREWSRSTSSWLTQLLRSVADDDVLLETRDMVLLKPHQASRQGISALATAMALEPDFTLRPQWHGRCAHTGSWSRLRDTNLAPASAYGLLGSRLAELVRLCLTHENANERATGRHWLSWGHQATGRDQGVAWVEMARGLLLHQVQLDPAKPGHILSCRVLAPTDWNFHSEGIAAKAIAELNPEADETPRRVALLMAALDPCVTYQIDTGEETQHA